MKEDWSKSIIIFIPVFLWCSPLQERIYNYSSPPNNNFQGSLIQSGILINSNKEFTSYALYTQYWVSPNLALAGSIAPYIAKNDLYHYQYIGANYQSINDENKLFITTDKGIVQGTIIQNEVNWSVYTIVDLDQSFFINGNIFNNQFREEQVIDIQSIPETNEFNIMTNRTLYNIKYKSGVYFFDLGDKMIYDDFTIKFTLHTLPF